MQILKNTDNQTIKNTCFFIEKNFVGFERLKLTVEEVEYVKRRIENDDEVIELNDFTGWRFIVVQGEVKNTESSSEKARKAGSSLKTKIKARKIDEILVKDFTGKHELISAFTEGLALSTYAFTKYFKETEKKENPLKKIFIESDLMSEKEINELNNLTQAVFIARDLANEPYSTLDSITFVEKAKELAEIAGFSINVMEELQIKSLKMGGLLAVNQGSTKAPFFVELEWKPDNSRNEAPYVFIGKGVVYDTGGYSLKPTSSMDTMKCDMSGAADVLALFYAAAKNGLPLYMRGFIPVTDNALSAEACRPGDVIFMHDGTSVEVLNTDAEGRLILADALSYAAKFNPELVLDFATLTGSAAAAIGEFGAVAFFKTENSLAQRLKECGHKAGERLVEFPLWSDYEKLLKSDIADLKNIGGPEAGAVTAAKFLEHFTSYPWIHIDIAGPAFIKSDSDYRTKGGTGFGVRLAFEFLKTFTQK